MVKKRFKMMVFTALIIRRGDEVLLMKRPVNLISGGSYALPGGGVDGGESIRLATVRETAEELGVRVALQDLKFVHVYHMMMDSGVEYINFFFESFMWDGEPRVMEPHKCEGIAWFNVHALPVDLLPAHRHVLEARDIFSEF